VRTHSGVDKHTNMYSNDHTPVGVAPSFRCSKPRVLTIDREVVLDDDDDNDDDRTTLL
jgi:hypothetical protein